MSTPKKPATSKIAGRSSDNFLSTLSAPARRALEAKGITTLKQLATFSETSLLQLHGMGKSSIPKIKTILASKSLALKEQNTKPSAPDSVNAYMKNLLHPLKNEAEALRQIILSAGKNVGEEIAWNAPSFFYTGPMKPFNPKEYKRFIVGFNFFKKDCVRLIFLRGAQLQDTSGLLQGSYADGRRLALFYSMEQVTSNGKTLRQLVKKSLQLLDK